MLSVVLDHLLHWPSGGFVGVDVFFVISGFLITDLLLREYDKTGAISFSGFYTRRVRRIMPAAALVLAVTTSAAYLIFSGARAGETLMDAIWSLFFAANWHFSSIGTDYFQASGPASPLQHFWSLALEEQFYFVWPWLLALIFWLGGRTAGWNTDRAKRYAAVTLGALVAVSFCWAFYQSTTNPTPAYFSTFTRAWELGLGALVAVTATAFVRIPKALRPVLAYIGLAGIILSALFVSANAGFPAPWAAAPVIATALVIIAGTGGAQRLLWPLTNKATGFVGDISYSLYLWHFPVIIFAQAFLPDEGVSYYAVSLTVMLILSGASFYLIEEPIRRSEWLLPKSSRGRKNREAARQSTKYVGLGVLAVVTALTCWGAVITSYPAAQPAVVASSAPLAKAGGSATAKPVDDSPEGVLSAQIVASLATSTFPDFTPSVDSLGTDNWSKRPEIACMNVSTGNMDSCLTRPPRATKTVAVLGDSFAVAWLPGIRAALEPLGYQVQALTMGQCPAASVSVNMEGGAAFPLCDQHRLWAIDRVRAIHPDLTILASAQGSTLRRLASGKTGQDAVQEMTDGLAKSVSEVGPNTGRLVVLSSPPTGKSLQACVTKVANPSSCVSELTDEWKSLRDGEAAVIHGANVSYVDTVNWFCSRDGYCPGFVGKTPVRVDTGHMSVEYSQMLAPVLAKRLVF